MESPISLVTLPSTVPAWQLGLYILAVAVLILMKREGLALAATYIFTLNWLYTFFRPFFAPNPAAHLFVIVAYAVLALVLAVGLGYVYLSEGANQRSRGAGLRLLGDAANFQRRIDQLEAELRRASESQSDRNDTELTDRVQELERQIEEKEELLRQAQAAAKLKDEGAEVLELEEALEEKEKALQDLRGESQAREQKLAQRIQELESQFQEKEKSLQSRAGETRGSEEKWAALEAQLRQKEQEVGQVRAELKGYADFKAKFEGLERELKAKADALSERNREVEALKVAKSQAEAVASKGIKERETLAARVNELESELNKKSGELLTRNKQFTELRTELEEQIGKLKKEMEKKETELRQKDGQGQKELKVKLEELEREIKQKTELLGQREREIAALKKGAAAPQSGPVEPPSDKDIERMEAEMQRLWDELMEKGVLVQEKEMESQIVQKWVQ